MAGVALFTPWNEAVEKVIDAPVEKSWAIAGDFLGFPSQHIDKIEHVKGEKGLPGCQRKLLYTNQKGGQNFVVEELVSVDAGEHKVTYKLVETDEIVQPGQEAYIQLTAESEGKTRIKWPFRFTSTQFDREMLTQIYQHLFNTWAGELERRARE
ncbi:uncharacterized protein [Physcomitrium patens]|uniref:Bet v I/Major latex protein domain-containing protein n=1 Tax=Physcomitrium patens TaxID=3218 RepID=A9SDK5_PHYPA|nr:uncharacterized protein LOC112294245 [Physcomitrium patens]PNR36618.1 hypothetical protein PHYPA_022469 [Physcomitrium patens]|eukprot:XP_024400288.1 uncharacterized protein LOC112294245 [Physcomitrella patens]